VRRLRCGAGAAFLAAITTGCAADLGGGGGVEVRSAHAVGFGRAAASTKLGSPLNDHGFLIGGSLESRAEANVGARYDAGIMLGWGTGPSAIGGNFGFETYVEAGTPIQSAIFRDGNFFAGAAVGMPVYFAKPRRVVDLNDSVSISATHLEFVPMLRARVHVDFPGGGDAVTKCDITGGVSLRLRFMSDLL
jgi:hypothetical protein